MRRRELDDVDGVLVDHVQQCHVWGIGLLGVDDDLTVALVTPASPGVEGETQAAADGAVSFTAGVPALLPAATLAGVVKSGKRLPR